MWKPFPRLRFVRQGKQTRFPIVLLSILLLNFIPIHSFATNPQLDSLQGLVSRAENTAAETAKFLFELATAYRPLDTDSAMRYAERSIEAYQAILAIERESRDNPLAEEEVLPHFLMANILYSLNQFEKSLDWIDKSEALMRGVNNDTLLGKVQYVKGNVLARLDRFEESIDFHNQAIATNKGVGSNALAARSDLNKGRLYGMLEKPEMAVAAYDSAIQILRVEKDSVNLGIGILNKGAMLIGMGDTVQAIANYEEAAVLFQTDPPSVMAVFALVNLAGHSLRQENLELATQQLQRAKEIAEENGMREARVAAYRGMGMLMVETKQYNQARNYYKRGWDLLMEYGQLSDKIDLLKDWIEPEELAGNYKEALRLERERNGFLTEIRDLDRTKFVEELTIQYESEAKEAENALLREREAKLSTRQKWIYILAGVVSFFLLTVILLLILSNRRKRGFNKMLKWKSELIAEKNQTLLSQNQLLKEKSAEKDALMGVVAHDLKAPLTKITAMVDVLEQTKSKPAEFERVSDMIRKVVHGGESLIEELVLMGSLDKADTALDLQKIEIEPALMLSVQGFEAQALAKSIALQCEPTSKTLYGMVHPGHFGRIIDNILSNAIKFSPTGSKVELHLKSLDDKQFQIRIEDNGPGIPPEEMPRLFDKFSRLSPRPTAGESSTGLGLSIAKGLVLKMNGKIDVQSTLGKGTQFTLTFPRA